MVKTRWECDICGSICEKRPFFNSYIPGKKRAMGLEGMKIPGAQWLCTTCKHPSKNHAFTFKIPKGTKDENS